MSFHCFLLPPQKKLIGELFFEKETTILFGETNSGKSIAQWKLRKARYIPALRGCHLSTWLSAHSTSEMRSAGLDLADIFENWNPGEKLNIEDFL